MCKEKWEDGGYENLCCKRTKKLDVDISRKLFSIAKENKISFYPSPLQAKITKYLIENNKREVYQKELEEVFEVRKATISGVLFTMEKNEVIKELHQKMMQGKRK